MFRTTVYLDEDTALSIRRLADIQNRSQADIIRDAVGKYLTQAEHQIRPPITGLGRYHSGRSDISEKAEGLLKQAAKNNR